MTNKTTNQDALDDAQKSNGTMAQQLKVVDDTFGNNLPYNQTRLEEEARFYLNQSAGAMLEAGKRLILLKEHEQHGEFTESLDRIGLAPRSARKMMQASLKYEHPKRSALAVLDKTKLFELMTEDDDALDELAEGGTIAGLTLDAIDKMSTRELKIQLRKAEADAEEQKKIKERQLTAKDKKINALDEQLHASENQDKQADINAEPSVDGIVLDYNTRAMIAAGSALDALKKLVAIAEEVSYDTELAANEDSQKLVGGTLYELSKRVAVATGNHMNECEMAFDHIRNEAEPLFDRWLEEREAVAKQEA